MLPSMLNASTTTLEWFDKRMLEVLSITAEQEKIMGMSKSELLDNIASKGLKVTKQKTHDMRVCLFDTLPIRKSDRTFGVREKGDEARGITEHAFEDYLHINNDYKKTGEVNFSRLRITSPFIINPLDGEYIEDHLGDYSSPLEAYKAAVQVLFSDNHMESIKREYARHWGPHVECNAAKIGVVIDSSGRTKEGKEILLVETKKRKRPTRVVTVKAATSATSLGDESVATPAVPKKNKSHRSLGIVSSDDVFFKNHAKVYKSRLAVVESIQEALPVVEGAPLAEADLLQLEINLMRKQREIARLDLDIEKAELSLLKLKKSP